MSLKNITLQSIIDMALQKVSDSVDKRTGSIVYDMIASVAVPILMLAMEVNEIENATFIDTSYGEFLDRIVASAGMKRKQATKAQKVAMFLDVNNQPIQLEQGLRFMAIDNPELIYVIMEKAHFGEGTYIVECEIDGTQGNLYYGDLILMDNSIALSKATITEDYVLAIDEETDAELKTRYLFNMTQSPFGGNVSQYQQEMLKIDGVGAVQVYRASDLTPNIIISVIDTNQKPIGNDFMATLQNKVCPGINDSGLGIAPIGHVVQIETPYERVLPVTVNVKLKTGYTVDKVQTSITEAIEAVFKETRDAWGIMDMNTYSYSKTIYLSRISAAAQNVQGVENVSSVLIDGSADDYKLQATFGFQDIATLGEVSVNAS